MVMWEVGSWSRATLISRLGLQNTAQWDDVTQLDQLRTEFDARTAQQKPIFFTRFEGLLMLAERQGGVYLTRSEVLAEIGII